MRLAAPRPPTSLLAWVGLLAAPVAWTMQHVAGISLTLADCGMALPGGAGDPGAHAPLALNAWTLVATAAATAVAVLGGIAAFAAWRSTRAASADTGPPEGRVHFLAVVGMTITPLFLFIIVMSGLTAIFFRDCHQA